MKKPVYLLLLALLLCAETVVAEVFVFSCEPEWGALAREIGGERIRAFSATTAGQDPHHIQARPSLIAKMRRADLLICSGADLEAGWLPLLLRRARNPKVQPGQPGYLMAVDQVALLEVPTRLDRSEGDIHAQGNPHLHLDPRNLLVVAETLSARLGEIDPDNAEYYKSALKSFQKSWTDAIETWQARADALRGESVVVHHKKWIYLLRWLGVERLAVLEPKPGVPPSAGHLASLQARVEGEKILAIMRSPIEDAAPSEWVSKRTGIPQLALPHTVGSTEKAQNLFSLFEEIISMMLQART